ncbi:sodium:solute symporter family protein [Planctomicrobium sp. SH664]|uniref:sodium:solute symporter family protein n=1 Tax=Planctomicrobium sp. SH664 TaxID=3448125 RepID=UPI003F5C919B
MGETTAQMQLIDYIVIALYLMGIVVAGMVFTSRMTSSKEMFTAGGQSPWWVSGLSGFMTMFSAGTFVVWGGIAYRYGAVAIVINLCYGVAAMLAGWFVAGRWRKLGVDSAAEFLQLRFGNSIVQFYTWFKGTVGLFVMGGSVYALAKIVCALLPLPEGHFLADPTTGQLSVKITSVVLCLMIIVITFSGGLWAVLVTDVLQFVILTVAVIFVVPMIVQKVGGMEVVVERAPPGFFDPVAGEYTWWFITAWVLVNFCMIGAEWAFVQRFLCVPTQKDAKKAAYLFGIMYFVSPVIWMLPPMIYRLIDPDLQDTEQAYIYACQSVLPAGMMGLMVASMASATISGATTRLNVFAGAFTTEVYKRQINHDASERQLVVVGRIITMMLGAIVIAGSLVIPKYGYTKFILDMNTLLYGPILMPTIWGLFSRKIDLRAVWVTVIMGFAAAYCVKIGVSPDGFLTKIGPLRPLVQWIVAYQDIVEDTVGIIVPLVVLLVFEISARRTNPGWLRVMQFQSRAAERATIPSSRLPGLMVGICLVLLAVMMAVLAFINREEMFPLMIAAAVLLGIGAVLMSVNRERERDLS